MSRKTDRRSRAFAVLLASVLTAATVRAEDPCASGGNPFPADPAPGVSAVSGGRDGIGGTGIGDGVGGTGIRDGIGGTGHAREPGDGGIGGTGIAQGPDEGGIGGTGISDRGILGVITGFASVCIGGSEVHVDERTTVVVDGQAAELASLAVGQVVQVEARDTDGGISAQRIVADHIVVGPVTAPPTEPNQLQIVGQRVQLSPDTLAVGRDWKLGDWVAVNGLRRDDGIIVASRLDPVASEDRVQLLGVVESSAGREAKVAGTAVVLSAPIEVGQLVRVTGEWTGTTIVAADAQTRTSLSNRGLRRIELETYLEQPPAGDVLRVGDLAVQIAPETKAALRGISGDDRVRLDIAVRPDGRLIAQSATPLKPLSAPRPSVPGPGAARGDSGGPALAQRGDPRPPDLDHDGRPPHGAPGPHLDRPPMQMGGGPGRPPVRPPFHPHDMRPPRLDGHPPPRPPMPRPPRPRP